MSLSLEHSPINSGGQTSQSLGWPHPVSILVKHWLVSKERVPQYIMQFLYACVSVLVNLTGSMGSGHGARCFSQYEVPSAITAVALQAQQLLVITIITKLTHIVTSEALYTLLQVT